MTASKHLFGPLLVALIRLKNTTQLIELVKTSHLGYFLARKNLINWKFILVQVETQVQEFIGKTKFHFKECRAFPG